MTTFICGICIGLALMWLFDSVKRRRIKLLEEDKLMLKQEKQIVVEFMHNMVEAVAEGSDRQTMFERIIHAAVLSTGAMSACIFEKRNDNRLHGVAVEGLFPPQRRLNRKNLGSNDPSRSKLLETILKSETFDMGEGIIGQVAASRQAVLIADADTDPRVIQHTDKALIIRSMIVAPVVFQDELIAVLAVANPSDGLAFNETDFSLVESLAEQVGLAVHNCDSMQLQLEKNKLDTDIELASNIQSLLLPTNFPLNDKVEFAAHYTAAQKIGGDLYDVFQIDDQRIGVAIADVSGKGIPASILMAICQTNLRHQSQHRFSPAQVLKAINAQMQANMRNDMFITIVYAIINLEKDELTIARAGHELPFHYHRSNEDTTVTAIESNGMALGMVPPEIFDATIENKTIAFGPDDALLLYTDGITEGVNRDGEEYTGHRLLENFKRNGCTSARGIVDGALKGLSGFTQGTPQIDDITLIAVKRH